MGRSSGGSTGSVVSTIHSGLLPLFLNASTTRSRLMAFLRFCPDLSVSSSWSLLRSASRSMDMSRSRTASAPMPARNTVENLERSSR